MKQEQGAQVSRSIESQCYQYFDNAPPSYSSIRPLPQSYPTQYTLRLLFIYMKLLGLDCVKNWYLQILILGLQETHSQLVVCLHWVGAVARLGLPVQCTWPLVVTLPEYLEYSQQ